MNYLVIHVQGKICDCDIYGPYMFEEESDKKQQELKNSEEYRDEYDFICVKYLPII